jgi:hypothetical protein
MAPNPSRATVVSPPISSVPDAVTGVEDIGFLSFQIGSTAELFPPEGSLSMGQEVNPGA